MIQRGKKSAASLAVVTAPSDYRPAPPADLTPEQQALWKRIVDAEPNDAFKTAATQTLLRAMIGHATSAAMLARLIDSLEPEWLGSDEGLGRYGELLKLRERETRAMGQIATRLRLTNQSRYTPMRAATASRNTVPGAKPWEPVV